VILEEFEDTYSSYYVKISFKRVWETGGGLEEDIFAFQHV